MKSMTLISPPGQVVYLKLRDGDDIIATLKNETDDKLVITDVLEIQRVVQGSHMAVAMLPWVPWTDLMSLSYDIDKSNIITHMALADNGTRLVTHYKKMIKGYQVDPTNEFGMMDFEDRIDDDVEDDEDELTANTSPSKRYLN